MSADYKQLTKFQKQIEQLNKDQKEQFLEACCKELAARLLRKVIKNTKSITGTLRRGWTGGTKQSGTAYADSLEIKKVGSTYHIDITNPVEYASYYEYGHRTSNHKGWVQGHFTLTIAETELNNMSDAILQKKLNKFMKDVFNI